MENSSLINDGGTRMSYGDGKAVREPSTGKGRFDLVTPFGWMRLAKWYELGAHKYSDRNWEKGMPFSRYVDSALRHIVKYVMGMTDEDHLSAAVWNLLCIIHHEELGHTELRLPVPAAALCAGGQAYSKTPGSKFHIQFFPFQAASTSICTAAPLS